MLDSVPASLREVSCQGLADWEFEHCPCRPHKAKSCPSLAVNSSWEVAPPRELPSLQTPREFRGHRSSCSCPPPRRGQVTPYRPGSRGLQEHCNQSPALAFCWVFTACSRSSEPSSSPASLRSPPRARQTQRSVVHYISTGWGRQGQNGPRTAKREQLCLQQDFE